MEHLVEPDKFQQAWQAQTSATRVTADAGLLLQEVRRNQRNFSLGSTRETFVKSWSDSC